MAAKQHLTVCNHVVYIQSVKKYGFPRQVRVHVHEAGLLAGGVLPNPNEGVAVLLLVARPGQE